MFVLFVIFLKKIPFLETSVRHVLTANQRPRISKCQHAFEFKDLECLLEISSVTVQLQRA